jgi:diaminohydroxyphosphoribosylaminopyrimidine deaminase/5-amino-6-(5-phosphoribosylamino)uracil reductase
VPSNLILLSPGEATFTLVVCANHADGARAEALRAAGAEVLPVPLASEGRLDLGELLRTLCGRGIMEVMVEGGGETARAFLDEGLVDRMHLFLSPRILGGTDSLPMVGGRGPDRIDEAWGLGEVEVERVGPDLYVTGVPGRS